MTTADDHGDPRRTTGQNTSQSGSQSTIHDVSRGDTRRPVESWLHPRVYSIAIALSAWLVLSVWLFAGSGITDYLLVIVSGFIFIAVMLPLILSRVARTDDDDAETAAKRPSFREWTKSEFGISQGRLSGREAALQILLPIAAVAFGMTAFGLALHFAEHGAHASAQRPAVYSSGSVVKNRG
jgi:hypothetical protein